MTRSPSPRRTLAAALLGLALLLGGCAQSSDPDTWESAEEGLEPGEWSTIEDNFIVACEEANEGGEGDVPAYCECSYDAVRDYFDPENGRSLEDFTDFEAELREDPEAINAPGQVPSAVRGLLDGCAGRHLVS